MAVDAHKTEPTIKSIPAMEKLNAFSGHTVSVTKHTAPRNTTGQMVVPTQQMKLNQILELQSSIPLSYGPGFYRFEVVDSGGSGSDAWMVKLGPDVQQEAFPMAGSSFAPPNGAGAPVAMDVNVRQIGPGYFYDQDLGTLVTPWRAIVQWRPGEPLPQPPTSTANPMSHLQFPQPSQWGGGGGGTPWGGSWGGYPAGDTGESATVRRLEAKIEEDRRAREAEQQRVETRRLMEDMQRRTDDQIARMMALFEKALTSPKGPSDEIVAMRAELAETKRMNEMREREDRLRTEMRDNQARFETALRELTANKSDPMLAMIMQIMQGTQAASTKAVEAIQATTATATSAAERNTQQMVAQITASIISPLQLMQMIETARSGGSEGSKMIVDSMRESLTMQREVFTQLLDVSSAGASPPWVPLVQEALQRIGMVGEQLAKRQPAPPPPPPMVRQQPQAQAMAGPPVRPQVAPPSTPVPQNGTQGATVVPIKPGVTPPQTAPAPSKRRRKRRGNNAVDAPPADPRGYTLEEMRDLDPKVIWEGTKQIADEQFFGEIYPYVRQIREQVRTSMPPAGAAEMLLRNRGYAQSMSAKPPAVDLLFAEQFTVLIARLLPDAPDAYKDEVVDVIEKTIIAEAAGPVDDDEDDEGEGDETEGDVQD